MPGFFVLEQGLFLRGYFPGFVYFYSMRKDFIIFSILSLGILAALAWYIWPGFWYILGVFAIPALIGVFDMLQTKHSLMRNFPFLGRMRWLMEALRPKLYQYFIESDIDGRPINRLDRSTIYQRAKQETDTMPFGTQLDVYAEGYEWMSHSIAPKDFHTLNHHPRIKVGNKDCRQPYDLSVLNVSAMSFGSLSPNAIMA